MALWAASGGSQEVWKAFDSWSANNDAYDAKAARARWKHYANSPPSKIGAGTIFRMAAQAGWSDPGRPPPPEGSDAYGKIRSKPRRETSEARTSGPAEQKALVDLLFRLIDQQASQKEIEAQAFAEGTRLGQTRDEVCHVANDVAQQAAAGA